MRLSILRPRWLELNGERVGIIFQCPCCWGRKHADETWLTCFFKAIADLPPVPDDYPIESMRGSRMHRVLFYEAMKAVGHPDPVEASYHNVVSCKRTIAWQRTGDDFETLSCAPSIDASQSGHWHGFIQAGNVT